MRSRFVRPAYHSEKIFQSPGFIQIGLSFLKFQKGVTTSLGLHGGCLRLKFRNQSNSIDRCYILFGINIFEVFIGLYIALSSFDVIFVE